MSRPPPHVHGKEGVDGSSPSEGFEKSPAGPHFAFSKWKAVGTRGHSRALAALPSKLAQLHRVWLVQRHWTASDPLHTVARMRIVAPAKEEAERAPREQGS